MQESKYEAGIPAAMDMYGNALVGGLPLETVVEGRLALKATPPGWDIKLLDLSEFGPGPDRIRATPVFLSLDSFIVYYNRFAGPGLAADSPFIYVKKETEFEATFDGHEPGRPGWGSHTATLKLRRTPEWEDWVRLSNNWMNQKQLAEFVDAHMEQIAEPSAADFAGMVATFRVNKSVAYESSVSLANGAVNFGYHEIVEGGSGAAGNVRIPESVVIVVEPFEGTQPQTLEAKLRWELAGKTMQFKFDLGHGIRRAEEDARNYVAERLEEQTGTTVLF